MTDIKTIFPNESYTESEVYEIASDNNLTVDDNAFNTFTILEVFRCDHVPDDPTGHWGGKRYGECDTSDDGHESIGEFRNDVGDGSRFYLET